MISTRAQRVCTGVWYSIQVPDMKLLNRLAIVALWTIPMIGCSGEGGPATVADSNDISAYVSSHPDSDTATEPEGGDL